MPGTLLEKVAVVGPAPSDPPVLFNSYIFLFAFLPLTLVGFGFIRQWCGPRPAMGWLIAASLVFYGYHNLVHVPMIVGSIIFNYGIGMWVDPALGRRGRKGMLVFGVAVNLVLLGFFKYAMFIQDTARWLADFGPTLRVALPLAISFFTFQQIAYVVDASRGQAPGHGFIDYMLFVAFFPQLIAGPIVHHRDMLPQFRSRRLGFREHAFAMGITIFAIGLAKKAYLADYLGQGADHVFDAAAAGQPIAQGAAWAGVLSYTLQIYFDFSGYSDMAIGLGRMFGVRLPENFNSPYKATSIVSFWRRWHMTLSVFLRDYLYIPLGGNRKGKGRRYRNLMLTMFLGGLWHGAGWTFVVWGGMHGLYLCVNHAWHRIKPTWWQVGTAGPRQVVVGIFSCGLTFLAVYFSWILFRAESFGAAAHMFAALFAGPGAVAAGGAVPVVLDSQQVTWALALLPVVWFLPNTQTFMSARRRRRRDADPGTGWAERIGWRWRPDPFWALATVLLIIVVLMENSGSNEFIYFEF
ncbi:MAG: MBOAT family protein [Phycisphaerae bacterium]|nr:MBOAT family protein [Phycisphaerae bacterium]